ncbi:chorismate-binding protein [Marinobacterium nitratireducens]|uniref:Chorismate-binding protein n=1 Tax=Marinobacterium nitratireducens TaxID=518897 RepID=A0A918DW46_9GAMM|nr:chromate efflux transporter [Marinobacterium nitratireducens]GGO87117.1 chorismate-binding protein [Marinobacterium nitratireducens]
MWQVFLQFLMLGCISFGGPAAHIGYFRNHFVERLNWLDDKRFADLLALCQFLPGPASSQLGFAIGYRRAGLGGALCAFVGFTLPSLLLMLLLAGSGGWLLGQAWFDGVLHGLKLLALVVVADAVLGMSRNFCNRRGGAAIAVLSAVLLLTLPGILTQLLVLVGAAAIGAALLADRNGAVSATDSGDFNVWTLGAFVLLLLLCLLISSSGLAALFGDFYLAGSLVFGGGHVVLPLLQGLVGDSLSPDRFLLGYAAAQAVPGPMFTLATFLGYELGSGQPVVAALLATVAVFLPGFLLLLGVQGRWHRLVANPPLAGAVAGVNAAVVGLLLAALYQPVFVSAVASGSDMALAVLGFFLLRGLRLGVIWLVPLAMLAGLATGYA